MKSIALFIKNKYFFTLILGIASFLFFGIFYRFHLHFAEQFQLFLLTPEYLADELMQPGGFCSYIGGFFVQFFRSPISGALIISVLLMAFQLLTSKIISIFNPNPALLPLSFFPAVNYWMLLCDNFFPISGLIGLTLSLLTFYFILQIKKPGIWLPVSLLSIIPVYFIAGGGYLLFTGLLFAACLISFFKNKKAGSLKITATIVVLTIGTALVAFLPHCVKMLGLQVPFKEALFSDIFYEIKAKIPLSMLIIMGMVPVFMVLASILKPKFKKAFLLITVQTVLLLAFTIWGLSVWMNISAERIMQYDYYARYEKWDNIVKLADRKPPRNDLSLSMLNLALAKTGQMPEKLFNYHQHGAGGLFLDFENENVAPMLGSEIFYQLGMVNASQYFSFESNESNASLERSVRACKRLTETNIINGQYGVTSKYLSLLEKTLFYRKWAHEARNFINNPQLIETHPVWSEKRKMQVHNDYFIMVNEMEKILISILNEHPSNKIAFEYLMSYYLISKNLNGFMSNLFRIRNLNYTQMPVLYQEAALFAVSLTNDNPEEAIKNYPVSETTKRRMSAYAAIYTTNANPKEMLTEKYSNSFWYYFHFK